MSVGAWIWFFIILFITWGIPGVLFFYRPKVDRSGDEVWPGIPYEHLKFDRKIEMLVIAVASVGFGWMIWAAARAGLLVWK